MATTSNPGVSVLVDSNAHIQAWASTLRATLIAGGWVQTSDTGQTNEGSLTTAAGTNTPSGYTIWCMADTLQATSPVFLKIEYGEGGSVYSAALWITIGTGSDGAGNLTGIIFPRTFMETKNSLTNGTADNVWGSADTNRLQWAIVGINGGTKIFFLSIEREKSDNGADNGNSLLVFMSGNQSSTSLAVVAFAQCPFTGALPAVSTTIGAFAPSGTTWAQGADVGVSPLRYFNGAPSNPALGAMVYLDGDLSRRVAVPLTVYGASHTYMPFGSDKVGTAASGNANATIMMRYE